MQTKLSLIKYILKKYKINNELIKDVVNFILNYEDEKDIINGYDISDENELSSYILSYLNDDIIDDYIYRICLDTATYIDNYDKMNKQNIKINELNRKMLINM